MKQPTFHGRVLLPLSVFAEARAGDPLAMERILRYYDGYMNKLCTRTLYELDGTPHVRVDEYMKPVSYTHLDVYKRQAFTSAPKVSKPGQSSTFAI